MLHRNEITKTGGSKAFEIFNVRNNQMGCKINLLLVQISLLDNDFLQAIGYVGRSIAMNSRDMANDDRLYTKFGVEAIACLAGLERKYQVLYTAWFVLLGKYISWKVLQ